MNAICSGSLKVSCCCSLITLLTSLLLIPTAWSDDYYPANPAVSNESIFIAQNGITQFDAADLQVGWQALPDLNCDAPVVTERAILIGSTSGLKALHPRTGKLLWQLPTSARLFSPSAATDTAYAAGEDGSLRAVNIDNGDVLWQRQFDGWVYAPAIFTEHLLTGGQEQRLYAIDRSNGSLLWQRELSQELVYRPIAIGDDKVVITTFSGEVALLSAADGRIIWRIQDQIANLSPLHVGERLYFRTFSGVLKVRRLQTGQLLWQSQQLLSNHPIHIHNNRVIARQQDGSVIVLNSQNGSTLWQQALISESIGSPLVIADRLVLFTVGAGVNKHLTPTVFKWPTSP